jgi:HK97 family phage prohead protease
MILKGAFDKDIALPLPMLLEHCRDKPLGFWTKYQSDDHGLWVEGILNEFIDQKKSVGLSVGFIPQTCIRKNGVLTIQKATLIEVSLVRNPAQVLTTFIFVATMRN